MSAIVSGLTFIDFTGIWYATTPHDGSWITESGPKAHSHAACLRRTSAPAALLAIIATSPDDNFRAATNEASLSTKSFGVNPRICSRFVPILTMTSRSSRRLNSGTPGDDVPPLRVMGAAAVAKSRCHSLARKLRHAAAEFAAGAFGAGVDLGQRLKHLGHPLTVSPLGV
ncbi:hypothetical protein HAV15_011130 [Penicillium sp. str. |nr:hypothetical protein HAV15_011130 [Penicillium sp. str. \